MVLTDIKVAHRAAIHSTSFLFLLVHKTHIAISFRCRIVLIQVVIGRAVYSHVSNLHLNVRFAHVHVRSESFTLKTLAVRYHLSLTGISSIDIESSFLQIKYKVVYRVLLEIYFLVLYLNHSVDICTWNSIVPFTLQIRLTVGEEGSVLLVEGLFANTKSHKLLILYIRIKHHLQRPHILGIIEQLGAKWTGPSTWVVFLSDSTTSIRHHECFITRIWEFPLVYRETLGLAEADWNFVGI